MPWFKKKIVNPYIQFHKLKIKNDNNYKEYLKWCYSVGEIPMDKYDYIKEITDKEKGYSDLIK
jgi:hypothetical protein